MVLERLRNHPNMYRRLKLKDGDTTQTEKLGWYTSYASKGPALSNMYEMLRQMDQAGHCPFRSLDTVRELLSFEEHVIKTPQGFTRTDWSARKGTHDDCVTDAWIACWIARHEKHKLSACNMAPRAVKSNVRARIPTRHGRFSWLRKEPTLSEIAKSSRHERK
jgi:hypothetical protein